MRDPWEAYLTEQYYLSPISERALYIWDGAHNFYFAKHFTVNGERRPSCDYRDY